MIKLLHTIYKRTFSKIIEIFMGNACRYTPTCSEYAKDAVGGHGIVRGTIMTIIRLARCNPWGGFGYDPVPKRK